ncbi:MAG: sigma-70 family RNA polymerase sigma factor [Phycisphaerae bacterium]|nr:sigma-70 family RNA polymerase sigma factor [Phycisphaerae bacterium]
MNSEKKIEEIAVYWTQAQSIVSAFISSTVPNFEDANDVLQSVAVAVVRKYDTYDRKSPFTAWAIGIARNEVLHYKRKYARDKHIFDDELVNKIAQTYHEKSSELDDMKKALEKCVSKIEGRWKQILQMRYVREMDAKRIAQCLGVSSNAVFVALHRIRLSLRECIPKTMRAREFGSNG